MVNRCPPAWRLPPQSDEFFGDLDHCNRRLRLYALAEGFDIVRKVPLPVRSLEARRSRPSSVFRLFPAEDEASTPPNFHSTT
jgi:hypothetical protein